MDTKIIDGKTYTEYSQNWETDEVVTLFLREDNGTIIEYQMSYLIETTLKTNCLSSSILV